jgi:hypothetical protein
LPPNQELFPVGTRVRVRDSAQLLTFRAEWQYHHPLQDEMLAFASCEARVAAVGFYHGGDVLYELDGVPGLWHEACLVPATGPVS